MTQPSAMLATPKDAVVPGVPETRLRGRRLVLAWIVGGAGAIFYLGLFVVSLPGYVAQLQTRCLATGLATDYPCMSGQLSPAAATTLQHLGVSLGVYAALTVAAYFLELLLSCALAALLVLRRPRDWMALLVALMLTTDGFGNLINPFSLAHAVGPALAVRLATISDQVGLFPYVLAFYLFPDGRFVPRWTRWVVVMGLLVTLLLLFFPRFSFAWSDTLSGVAYIGTLLSLVIAQVYRYRRVSTQLQRQQTKFVLYSLALIALLSVAVNALTSLFPSLVQTGSLLDSLGNTVYSLLLVLIPVSIGAAILRYRLWDIDALINKTLVYGSLTGILGALYAGLIIGLESLAGLFGGQAASNPLVLVISTLVIAALFLPVRRRIQSAIDRRFYRKKYDAEKTLAAFSASLRQETDLEQLREQLLAVVQETMQPAHVSLWLRPPEQQRPAMPHRMESDGPVSTQPSDSAGVAQLEEQALTISSGLQE